MGEDQEEPSLDNQTDIPVAARPTTVCEVCGVLPVTTTVTDHQTGETHQYCGGCYFILHPPVHIEDWP
jgi:hypothetical protein